MTAIGLGMFLVGWLGLFVATEMYNAPDWVKALLGIITVIGGLVATVGVFIWIWRVMP
jgi:predicted membrane channel-forming protein YqfA (hemolysin III family)